MRLTRADQYSEEDRAGLLREKTSHRQFVPSRAGASGGLPWRHVQVD